MGGLGRANGKPGYHSPNTGGSVSSKRSINRSQRGTDAYGCSFFYFAPQTI
jgi:hypothetical protein